MTQHPNDLAEKLMQLWQQQLQSMMQDGDFIQRCFDMLQGMSAYATVKPHDASPQPSAPDALAFELRQLTRRVEQLEAQLATRSPKPTGTGAAKRAASHAGGTRKKASTRAGRKP